VLEELPREIYNGFGMFLYDNDDGASHLHFARLLRG
jgi:hypothetical protein